MNDLRGFPIPDVQGLPDTRKIAIDRVGIKSMRHPVRVVGAGGHAQPTVATFDMYVRLPDNVKGTHMSRFVEILNAHSGEVSIPGFQALLRGMLSRLEASEGYIEMRFAYFIDKAAPVSGVRSLLDYEVSFIATVDEQGYRFTLKVQVPVTSLCPCSKGISDYGAHNQRAHITVAARLRGDDLSIEELVRICEEQASCEVFGLLKRPDEKYVTERAYDNPKFVEDAVRDIAGVLNRDDRIEAYVLESENFESIHNHSAYARVDADKGPRRENA